MSKLVVCLGYNLLENGIIHPILENRLKDALELCHKEPDSTLLLMGSRPYQGSKTNLLSEASAMKEYVQKNSMKDLKIIIEETTSSAVEQLCYLKEYIKANKLNYTDLVVVSSKFFGDRIRLYAEYIFGKADGVGFIESNVPSEFSERFHNVEQGKLKKAQEWLKNHTIGDDQKILIEQRAFQDKVASGEFNHPIS